MLLSQFFLIPCHIFTDLVKQMSHFHFFHFLPFPSSPVAANISIQASQHIAFVTIKLRPGLIVFFTADSCLQLPKITQAMEEDVNKS